MFSSSTSPPSTPIAIIKIGDKYQGNLEPTHDREREHCYRLPQDIGKDIRLDLSTKNRGTIRFALYDRDRQTRFYLDRLTNPTDIEAIDVPVTTVSNNFKIPSASKDRLLCLTTSNRQTPQKYEFRVSSSTPKIISEKSKTQPLVLVKDLGTGLPDRSQSIAKSSVENPAPENPVSKPAPPTPPPAIITDGIKTASHPQPTGCYIGSWQVRDLSQYWLPTIQNLTQAQLIDPLGSGSAKLTFNPDGKSQFEARNLQQKFTLKAKNSREKIDDLNLRLQGQATANYQVQENSSLLFTNQAYDRLTTQMKLATGLILTGGNLFQLYGETDRTPTGLPYQCIDAQTLKIFLPVPNGSRLMPITLKRV
jgi:hypothetical protein